MQKFHNHKAWPSCRNDAEKVACIASAMRRLGEGCTMHDLKLSLGASQADIEKFGDDARSLAMQESTRYTRTSVPASRAA